MVDLSDLAIQNPRLSRSQATIIEIILMYIPSKRSFTSHSSIVCSSASAPHSNDGTRSSENGFWDCGISNEIPRSRSVYAVGFKLSEVGNLLDLMATRMEDSDATTV